MIDVMTKFAEMFKGLRKNQNLTQEQVADKIGTTIQFVCNIENARALLPPEKIKVASEILKVDAEKLAAAVMVAKGYMYYKRAGLKVKVK